MNCCTNSGQGVFFQVRLSVEQLRIHPVPPLALAIGDRLHAVVRNTRQRACRVALVANGEKLIPDAMRRSVIADSESQSVGARRLRPGAHDVALRADVDAVPGLILRIPAIEVVVMSGQGDEIFRTGPLVELDQRIGVPSLRLP